MPEFDLPGHNMSLVKLYPSMRDPEDKSYEVSAEQPPIGVRSPRAPCLAHQVVAAAAAASTAMAPAGSGGVNGQA